MISQDKVVNSLIDKNLDWTYGEIIQTGYNTYYYKFTESPEYWILGELPPNSYINITFINKELRIDNKNKIVYSERLSSVNEEKLKEHINNKLIAKKDASMDYFERWIENK